MTRESYSLTHQSCFHRCIWSDILKSHFVEVSAYLTPSRLVKLGDVTDLMTDQRSYPKEREQPQEVKTLSLKNSPCNSGKSPERRGLTQRDCWLLHTQCYSSVESAAFKQQDDGRPPRAPTFPDNLWAASNRITFGLLPRREISRGWGHFLATPFRCCGGGGESTISTT